MNYRLSALPKGLRVLTLPMPDHESVSVAIWVAIGSRYESPQIAGISHFLEHMVFKGTRKRTGREIRLAIEGRGGLLNAFTGEESTCYFAKILSPHLNTALEVLSDMVQNATFEAAEVQKEKAVILEEIKMHQDVPSQYVHEMMGEMLWPKHPLGRAVSGTVESVSKLTAQDLAKFRGRHYHLKNILVSAAGPVRHEEVVKLVQRLFEKSQSGAPASFEKAAVRRHGPQASFLEKTTEQTSLVIGFRAFSKFHPDRYPLALLNVILGANMTSRLFEEVREKRGLAYEVRSGLSYFRDTGCLLISAGVETRKARDTVRVILSETEKLKQKGARAGELRRAKDFFMSQFLMALEDSLEHLLWVGERMMDESSLPDPKKIRQSIEKVRLSDLKRAAKKILVSEGMNLALVGPLGKAEQDRIRRDFYLKGASS